jgi:nucleotidyltransferase/DNA polymerase involved in DNA repair
MPGYIGLKLCPELIMIKPHFDVYQQTSDLVMDVLRVG